MVTRDATSEVLSSGLIREEIPKLKKRLRSYYFKRITVKGGDMVWVRTELLPSDMLGRSYYLSKGFRLDPPEGTEWAKARPPKLDDPEKVTLRNQVADLEAQLRARNSDPIDDIFGTEGQAKGG